jgi:hypothetical protein
LTILGGIGRSARLGAIVIADTVQPEARRAAEKSLADTT